MSYPFVAAISFAAGFAIAAVATSGRGPGQPTPQSVVGDAGGVAVEIDSNQQCFVDAVIGSLNVRFLLDTGADGIYLNRSTAGLLGFGPNINWDDGLVSDIIGHF